MPNFYVYCPRKSTGAFEIVKALGATRLRRFDGYKFWNKGHALMPPAGSVIVCWGAHLPALDGYKIVNSREKQLNKLEELNTLTAAGVSCISAIAWDRKHTADEYARAGYVGRRFDHQGGSDLLRPSEPNYFTQKMDFASEVRIHSFNGKSIRAGQKVLRDGFTLAPTEKAWKINAGLAHPWVRSYDGGWRIKYDGFKSSQDMRNVAHAAVKALGMTFGAVDIGVTAKGTSVVLEVNSAPGVEGNSLQAYAKAIKELAGVA